MTQTAAPADLMDRIYRHQRHLYDFTRKYYLPGRDRLIDRLKPAAGDCVLEIGCGTARNLVVAARRYPQARFFGIDVSSAMLATAGGELHIVDFGGQEGLPAWFRRGFRRWLARFHVTPRDELERDLARIAERFGAGSTVERPYRGYAQYAIVRTSRGRRGS